MKKTIAGVITLGSILVQISTASAADIHDGLVAYWPFETTDTVTTPDVAYTNHLNLVGAPTLVAAANASTSNTTNAFLLNGASQYLTLTHPTKNPVNGLPIVNAGRYTVAMWVKGPPAPNATARYPFAEGQSTSTGGPLLYFRTILAAGGKVEVFLRNTASVTFLNNVRSTNTVFDNNWHHIAWVDDNGAAKLYVDGNLDPANFNYTPGTLGGYACDITTVGALIRGNISGFYNGTVDDVALFERPLSQSEVQQIMTNGIATPIPQTNAPVFTRQPAGSTNQMGDRVIFSASAMGTHPLAFQWYKDGNPILDATDTPLILTDLSLSATNIYRVDVSNINGTISSDNVTHVVLPDPASNIPGGLISFWPFNTVDVNNKSPDLYSQNDMQLNSMDSGNLVPGQFGNALAFDGTEYVNRVSGSPLYNNVNYTVSLWVNGNGAAQAVAARVFSEASTNANAPLFSIATDSVTPSGLASMFVRNDANSALLNGRNSTRVVFDGNWHHVVWVDENGAGKLYVDGVLDETDFSYTRGTLTLNTLAVGAILRSTPPATVNRFTGAIDEVAMWNRRLTYTEIQEIKNQGVPSPPAEVPPSIIIQPTAPANTVFAGDTVSFTVEAAGTSPLSYSWNKDGLPIDGIANPSALTNVLVLTNVQAGDVGNYFVTVTNVAGTTNSVTVQLAAITPYTPATNGAVLNLDFDLTAETHLQPGFSRMTLASNPANFGSVGVTVSIIGSTALSDRHRGTPTNNPPDFTQADIYNDFIFSSSTADGTGAKILIERLAPNTAYGLTVWSWDRDNFGDRVSDWIETASGAPVPIATSYTWDGTFVPTKDYMNTFGALLTSSSTGKLQIEGRKNGGTGISVFVNALQLVANPVVQIIDADLVNGNLRLTVQAQYPGQSISIQERTDLGSGGWGSPVSGGVVETRGPIVIAEFPAGSNQSFYRVTSP